MRWPRASPPNLNQPYDLQLAVSSNFYTPHTIQNILDDRAIQGLLAIHNSTIEQKVEGTFIVARHALACTGKLLAILSPPPPSLSCETP